jgi:hypothetical protein
MRAYREEFSPANLGTLRCVAKVEEEHLDKGEPATLPRLDEFAEWLARRIEQRIPAAIVRFGDGERSVLEARLENAESMAIATGKLNRQSGQRFSPDAVLEIRQAIARAFDEADILGVLFGRFDKERINWFTSLYLEHVAEGRRKPAILSGCQLHHAIVDRLPGLLEGRRVSAISCRDVKPVLEDEWGLDDVVVYQVPSQHSARDVDDGYEAAMHDTPIWPDALARVRLELTVRQRGEVFLVGAGMFGKDLCIDVRERGGLALDLGSGLDRIVGKITRGPMRWVRVMRAEGMQVGEIVAKLEDRFGVELNEEKVRKLTEEDAPHSVSNPHALAPLRRDQANPANDEQG